MTSPPPPQPRRSPFVNYYPPNVRKKQSATPRPRRRPGPDHARRCRRERASRRSARRGSLSTPDALSPCIPRLRSTPDNVELLRVGHAKHDTARAEGSATRRDCPKHFPPVL